MTILYPIAAVETPSTLVVAGNRCALVTAGLTVSISGSAGNDGSYAVMAATFDGDNTRIVLDDTLTDAPSYGVLSLPSTALDARGSLALAQEACRVLLAALPATLRFLQSADAATALDLASAQPTRGRLWRVGLPPPADGAEYTPDELAGYRPFAVVGLPRAQGYSRQRNSAYGSADRGTLHVGFECDVPEELLTDLNAAERLVLNQIGQIVDALLDGDYAAAGALNVTGVSLIEGPIREVPTEVPAKGTYFRAILEITWDGGSEQ